MQYVSRPHHYIGNRRQENNGLRRIGVPARFLGGRSIRDGLYFLKERWDPVIQFDDFHSSDPETHGRHTRDHLVQRIPHSYVLSQSKKSPTGKGNSRCGSAIKPPTLFGSRHMRSRRKGSGTPWVHSRKTPSHRMCWGLREPAAITGWSSPGVIDLAAEGPVVSGAGDAWTELAALPTGHRMPDQRTGSVGQRAEDRKAVRDTIA